MISVSMKTTFLFVVSFVFLLTSVGKSQSESINKKLSGNLNVDSKIAFNEYEPLQVAKMDVQNDRKKSPFLAGLMSLVIPGAGQVYTQHYLEAGIFVAIEGALITTAIIYNKKGNQQTADFERYANQNWSMVKYAEWLNQWQGGNVVINSDSTLLPWQRINLKNLNDNEVGSHHLAAYGSQQYYELIGKYEEYSPGWAQFNSQDNNEKDVPAQMIAYSHMRGDANNLYTDATRAITFIFVNHLLSAIDAAWGASRYNNNLIAMQLKLNPNYYANSVSLYPTLNLSYNF